AWAKLIAEHGEPPPTLASTTATGGRHLFFRYHEGMRTLIGRLAPDIDIKSDDGYVILPPSFRIFDEDKPGASYRWDTPLLPIAEAPDWLVAKILALSKEPVQEAREEPRERAPVPLGKILSALDQISLECDRDTWWRIGCALYNELGDTAG